MPAELKNSQITFTSEAEAAIGDVVSRFERRVRSRAIDEALRLRGVPSEITRSDVLKADSLARREPTLARDSDLSLIEARRMRDLREEHTYFLQKRLRRTSIVAKLLSMYSALGIAIGIAGLAYAPVYEKLVPLLSNPLWKKGLTVSLCGIIIASISGVTEIVIRRIKGSRYSMQIRPKSIDLDHISHD